MKTPTYYQVWVKPENGPLTVYERDEKENWTWLDKEKAIEIAEHKAKRYFNIDFLVVEYSSNGTKKLVFDTSAK